MAKNTGKVREFRQSGKVGTLYIVCMINCVNNILRSVILNAEFVKWKLNLVGFVELRGYRMINNSHGSF